MSIAVRNPFKKCKWGFCEPAYLCGPTVTHLLLTFPKSRVLPQAVPELAYGLVVFYGKKAWSFLMQGGRVLPLEMKLVSSPLCLLRYSLWHWSLHFSCSRKMAKATAGGNVPQQLWSKPGPMTRVEQLSSEMRCSLSLPARMWWLGALLNYKCSPKTCRGGRSSSSSISAKSNKVVWFSVLSIT